MTNNPLQEAAVSAPDPEEDDLDDLDDVLDSFQETRSSETKTAAATSSTSATTAPTASGPGRPKVSHNAGSDEDFTAQLQAGMSNLISELGENPEMQAEFEKMMQELVAAGAAGTDQEAGEHLRAAAEHTPKSPEQKAKEPASSKSGSSKAGGAKGEDFNDTIRKTMERMQISDSTAKQSTTKSADSLSEEDMLAQMMRELTESGAGGEGGEEGFNAMLMNMMAHLTNKEILYEPMKELHDNFPGWFEKNAAKTEKHDLERYKEQQTWVREIVERFERKEYSDENEDDREYIVERMQKVCTTVLNCRGQPIELKLTFR